MKRIWISIFLLAIFDFALAQNFPAKSTRLVNDYVGILSADEQSSLEQKLVKYNDSTSTQVAIVIIKNLDGYEVSDYAARLAESWGIGQKEKDNGVLILASIDDRKITIQTGYGMEGVLPDAIAKRIIEQEIKPAFKAGKYYEGFDQASSTIFKFAAGEYTADSYKKKKSGPPTIVILVIFVVLVIALSRRKKKYQSFGGRGGGGMFFPPFIGGGGGSGWGGSSGGGGFGGFGGGSFGGGGASGSW